MTTIIIFALSTIIVLWAIHMITLYNSLEYLIEKHKEMKTELKEFKRKEILRKYFINKIK